MWCRYCSWKNYPKKTSLPNWWVMDCGGWVFWDFWAFWPGGSSCTAIVLLLPRSPQQSCCRKCRGLCLGNWRHDCCDCQQCFQRDPPPPRSCFKTGPYGMRYENRSAVPAEWAIDSRAKPSYNPKRQPMFSTAHGKIRLTLAEVSAANRYSHACLETVLSKRGRRASLALLL